MPAYRSVPHEASGATCVSRGLDGREVRLGMVRGGGIR